MDRIVKKTAPSAHPGRFLLRFLLLFDGIGEAGDHRLFGGFFRVFGHRAGNGVGHAVGPHGKYLGAQTLAQPAADAVFVYAIFAWRGY